MKKEDNESLHFLFYRDIYNKNLDHANISKNK